MTIMLLIFIYLILRFSFFYKHIKNYFHSLFNQIKLITTDLNYIITYLIDNYKNYLN